ncbi:MAG: hypothetical protein Q4D62_02675 [Planctomycetia bacterium]|nr:hypothetical protein [Planctomycetia bacterium]
MRHFFYGILGIVLACALVGCRETETPSETSTSHSMGGDTNDPRWREKMLQNSIQTLQRMADTRNPDDAWESMNQCVERLHSWIQDERTPEGWRVEPLAEKWVTALESVEQVRRELDAWLHQLRLNQAAATQESLGKLLAALQEASGKITSDFPPVMQALKAFLETSRQRLEQVVQAGEWSPELGQHLGAMEIVLQRTAILTRTPEKAFQAAKSLPEAEDHPLRHAWLFDSAILLEQYLLRDISLWAQGKVDASDRTQDLEIAGVSDVSGIPNHVQISADDQNRVLSIFDWVVTNISLDRPEMLGSMETLQFAGIPQTPVETLLSGHGNVLERAWVFILLARQQHLNVVLLEIPTTREENQKGRYFLLGYVTGEEIFLMDPHLGIPVPGGKAASATWKEFQAQPNLLNDLFQKIGYQERFTPEDLAQTRFLVEASPWYGSLRMRILQARLTGKERAVLVSDPASWVEQLQQQSCENIALWTYPYEVYLWRALNFGQTARSEMVLNVPFFRDYGETFPLWRGRMLYLKGILTGPLSATFYYQKARPSDRDLEELQNSDAQPGSALLDLVRILRLDASYFMGNISYAVHNVPAAEEYYEKHVLQSPLNNNPWKDSTHYLCGRLEESVGNQEKAAQHYEAVQGRSRFQALTRKTILHD